MQRLLDAYHAEPNRIIGLDPRGFDDKGTYQGPGQGMKEAKFALTRTMMFHRRYLQMYIQDKFITDIVESEKNCEDVSMNFVAPNASGQWAKILPVKGQRRELAAPDGLYSSSQQKGNKPWGERMNQCVQWMMEHFKKPVDATKDLKRAAPSLDMVSHFIYEYLRKLYYFYVFIYYLITFANCVHSCSFYYFLHLSLNFILYSENINISFSLMHFLVR